MSSQTYPKARRDPSVAGRVLRTGVLACALTLVGTGLGQAVLGAAVPSAITASGFGGGHSSGGGASGGW